MFKKKQSFVIDFVLESAICKTTFKKFNKMISRMYITVLT